MNTKGCIEFLEGARPSKFTGMKLFDDYKTNKTNEKKIDEIIKRLQMWEDFKDENIKCYTVSIVFNDTHRKQMGIFEQEYLLKENSDNELSEIVNTIIEIINKSNFTCEEVAKRLIPKG